MANEIITTLHPDKDPNTNLYPNIKKDNIPNGSVSYEKLGDDVQNLLSNIGTLKPSGVNTSTNILAFNENKGIWIGSDTGNWYYWDGTQYVSGGVYQASQIGARSILSGKLNKIYVEGVGGKNKFDYTALSQGYYSDVDGSYSSSSGWHYEKIDVSDFTSGYITLSGTLTYVKIAFFNDNDNFISGYSGSSSQTSKIFNISSLSQIPSYMYISILSGNDGANIQIEDNLSVTSYENFIGVLKDNSVTENKTSFMNEKIYLTKNILNINNTSNQYCSLTNNNDGSWTIIDTNNTNVNRLMLIKEIYLEVGDYTLSSQDLINDDGTDYGGIYIYDTLTHNVKITSVSIGKYLSQKSTFTISNANTYYVYVSIPPNTEKTFTCFIQLEKGNKKTSWIKAYDQVIVNDSIKKYIDLNYVKNDDLQSLLNISKLKNTYRYLVPTFYNSRSDGLIILGSNDLRTFDLIYKRGLFITTKTFNNGNTLNTLRDPSIIQIGDYYYFVYSIMAFETGDNKIGMCRTKDFITFEELDNISVNDPTSTHNYLAIWAPDWFRDGNKIYIVMTGKYGSTDFETLVYEYDPETHTINNGFVKSFDGRIDGHLYKLNGNYYCAIGGYHLYKSPSLNGDYTEISIGVAYPNCEASFILRKDDGTYRFYAQQLSSYYGTAHMVYRDSLSNNIEDGFGDVHLVDYTYKALEYAQEIHNTTETLNDEYWHWTIFDFNNSNFNNNNFTD